MSDWASTLNTPARRLDLDNPKVYDLPAFDGYQDPKKLDVLARLAEQSGRDPALATLAVQIFRSYGVQPRDYKGQAAALLRWVQTNIYYVNEPDERLQEPKYTLRVRYGDCDDMAILLYALARSVRLPAQFVISGVDKQGRKRRYHQIDKHFPPNVRWGHIYIAIGDQPYGEPTWWYAEPTLKNVPLGWDVVGANSNALPELRSYAGTEGVDMSDRIPGIAATVPGPSSFWRDIAFTMVSAVAADIALSFYREWKKSKKSAAEKAK
jgi:transglutaminase-like putative cysteine protease